MANWLSLIPLLPFAGFLINGLLGRRLPRACVTFVACAGPAIGFLIAALAFLEIRDGTTGAAAGAATTGTTLIQSLWTWISAGRLDVEFAFQVDRLTAVMLLFVTGVGTLIHVYSSGYMREDEGYAKFFAYLNLFMSAMLVLVLADNIVLLFLGWEGVGLCSYLLIGFWHQEPANSNAGIKAFVVNRIGDLAFLLGIFGIWMSAGSFSFTDINAWAAGIASGGDDAGSSAAFWIALCLFIGATGKSAQIPLFVWLPDAMAGPTPVSALIHAATMVTSGVYMVARLGPLFDAAPEVLAIIATIGALTSLVAAVIAFSQNDIKKVLAYSTVSQLGYMFLAAGVGAYSVAVFHVVTHAFFKALLFLSAGSVIWSLHHEQDMRRMGGLWKRLPHTFAVFLIGALALAGFPLLAGFWSKDEILHVVHLRAGEAGASAGWTVLWIIGLVTAFLTAFYTFRQVSLVFLGRYRGEDPLEGHETRRAVHADPAADPHDADVHTDAHAHAHGPLPMEEVREAPLVMRVPLQILALLSIAGGFFAVPHWLAPDDVPDEHGKLAGLVLGGAIAIAGIGAALFVYLKTPGLVRGFVARAPTRYLWSLSYHKLWIDEVYHALIVRPLWFLAEVLFYLVDRLVIDFLCVHGSGFYVRGIANLLRRLQSGRVPTYAAWFLVGAVCVIAALTAFRTG